MTPVDLGHYDNAGYLPGRSWPWRVAWYVVNALVIGSWWFPSSALKCGLLRAFGASVGAGVTIKPRVNIKYPWHLGIGDHVWIGEGVWIDNLARVEIESHVCLSQGAYLLTGNHDYTDRRFRLRVDGIGVRTGAWIGARAVVCPGVEVGAGTVLSVGSCATRNLRDWSVYSGTPARFVRERRMKT